MSPFFLGSELWSPCRVFPLCFQDPREWNEINEHCFSASYMSGIVKGISQADATSGDPFV